MCSVVASAHSPRHHSARSLWLRTGTSFGLNTLESGRLHWYVRRRPRFRWHTCRTSQTSAHPGPVAHRGSVPQSHLAWAPCLACIAGPVRTGRVFVVRQELEARCSRAIDVSAFAGATTNVTCARVCVPSYDRPPRHASCALQLQHHRAAVGRPHDALLSPPSGPGARSSPRLSTSLPQRLSLRAWCIACTSFQSPHECAWPVSAVSGGGAPRHHRS